MRVRNFRRISIREERVGWVLQKDWNALRAVIGSSEISEDVADCRVRIGLLVDGEIVVMVDEV